MLVITGSGDAAPAATIDLTSSSTVVVESWQPGGLPNDPNRCISVHFLQFPSVQGATTYFAVVHNDVLNANQPFSTGPPYPHDSYTVSLGASLTHTFTAPGGMHRIVLGSESSGSGCTTAPRFGVVSVTTEVSNPPPTASFTWHASNDDPLTIELDASASTDDEGIDTYRWMFGDGETGSGETTSHTYEEPGTYPVTLTVTDTDGATDAETQDVDVASCSGQSTLSARKSARSLAAQTARALAEEVSTFKIVVKNTRGEGVRNAIVDVFDGCSEADAAVDPTGRDGVAFMAVSHQPGAGFTFTLRWGDAQPSVVESGPSTTDIKQIDFTLRNACLGRPVNVIGTGEADTLALYPNDAVDALAGADTITGTNQGNDPAGRIVCGGADGDTVDLIGTGDRPDQVDGGPGADSIGTGGGNDRIIGGDDADLVAAGRGADEVYGNDGADTLRGGDGCDAISGGDGSDTIDGGGDADAPTAMGGCGLGGLDGGPGIDTITGGAGADLVVGGGSGDDIDGGAGPDLLSGNDGPDTINGGGGNDQVIGGSEVDHLFGGDGCDALLGEGGNDQIDAGAGNDGPLPRGCSFAGGLTGGASGGPGNDTVVGGAGADFLRGDGDCDLVDGRPGNDIDTLSGGDGDDNPTACPGGGVYGGGGADVLAGDAGADLVDGGADGDLIDGGAGSDELRGGAGKDEIRGDGVSAGAPDRIFGDGGIDTITGGDEPSQACRSGDVIFGGDGNDIVHGGGGGDAILGEAGNDQLWGEGGCDDVYGGPGGDTIDAGDNPNGTIELIWGEEGGDELHGGFGDDALQGGAGLDWLYGEAGADVLDGGVERVLGLFLPDPGPGEMRFPAEESTPGAPNDQLDGGTGPESDRCAARDDPRSLDDELVSCEDPRAIRGNLLWTLFAQRTPPQP